MIPGLDGLRAIAFILVFLFHAGYIEIGWVGVSLFFVLSGFLITEILIEMKKSLPSRDYFMKFYGRRFLRIFPLYYFYLLLMFGVAYWLYAVGYRPNRMLEYFEQAPYALAYVYNFFSVSAWFERPSYLTSHLWSLSVEEQFYIFWPLLILFTPRSAYKRLFIAAILAGPICRIGLSYIYNHHTFAFLGSNPASGIYALPFSHLDAFGFGALITQYRIPRARQQFWILLFTLPTIGFVTQYIATGEIGFYTALGYPFPLANGYKQIWGYSLLNYFFAISIYAVAFDGLFNRFLELGWMKYLGKISYGLYIYHYSLIFFIGRIQDVIPMSYEQAIPIIAVFSFVASLLLASLSFKYIETPILSLKDKYFQMPVKRPEQSASIIP